MLLPENCAKKNIKKAFRRQQTHTSMAKSCKHNTEETDTDLTRKNITQNQDPKSLAKQKMIHALPPHNILITRSVVV